MSRARATDVFAGLILIPLAPLLLCIALLLCVLQGRPVLFRQRRCGKDGVPFEMIKFRTMNTARDAEGNLLPDAERVTALGRFLRRTRIDELPEFWNIARGEMALVGPRPLLPETVEALGAAGIERGSVRPGLTGWAQVNGNTLLSLREKLELDLWYVTNRSFKLDLTILVRTAFVMCLGEKINTIQLERAFARGHHRRG